MLNRFLRLSYWTCGSLRLEEVPSRVFRPIPHSALPDLLYTCSRRLTASAIWVVPTAALGSGGWQPLQLALNCLTPLKLALMVVGGVRGTRGMAGLADV